MKSLLILSTTLVSIIHAVDFDSKAGFQEPHLKVEPNHYLDFPVTKKDF